MHHLLENEKGKVNLASKERLELSKLFNRNCNAVATDKRKNSFNTQCSVNNADLLPQGIL